MEALDLNLCCLSCCRSARSTLGVLRWLYSGNFLQARFWVSKCVVTAFLLKFYEEVSKAALVGGIYWAKQPFLAFVSAETALLRGALLQDMFLPLRCFPFPNMRSSPALAVAGGDCLQSYL